MAKYQLIKKSIVIKKNKMAATSNNEKQTKSFIATVLNKTSSCYS